MITHLAAFGGEEGKPAPDGDIIRVSQHETAKMVKKYSDKTAGVQQIVKSRLVDNFNAGFDLEVQDSSETRKRFPAPDYAWNCAEMSVVSKKSRT